MLHFIFFSHVHSSKIEMFAKVEMKFSQLLILIVCFGLQVLKFIKTSKVSDNKNFLTILNLTETVDTSLAKVDKKTNFEIIDKRYSIPIPPCGDECDDDKNLSESSHEGFARWPRSYGLNMSRKVGIGLEAAEFELLSNFQKGLVGEEMSQFAALAVASNHTKVGGVPRKHDPPVIKNNVKVSLIPIPSEKPQISPPLPPGNDVCNSVSNDSSKLQSPIPLGRPSNWNITSMGPHVSRSLPKNGERVSVNKYYGRLRDRFYMENDGYNLNFYMNEDSKTSELTMKVKEWDDEYVFGRGILHWGRNDKVGSEHTLNGRRYPLEIQLVHYKKSLKSMKEAEKKKFGVMIASILFDFTGFNKDYLDPIIRQGAGLAEPGRIKQVHGPLEMAKFFPTSLEHYEYTGSYSTIPCGKQIRRLVFISTVGVGRDQLKILRRVMKNYAGKPMIDNYRPLQEIGKREILYNPTFGQLDIQNRDSLMTPPVKTHW